VSEARRVVENFVARIDSPDPTWVPVRSGGQGNAWLAEPAAMPRVQNESVVTLLAADFSDDATIAASLAGVRVGIERAYRDLEEMERRALQIPTARGPCG
jgi:hypothetical protein